MNLSTHWALSRVVCIVALTLLGGCTHIERLNVNTVAVNCDIERGDEQAASGNGEANVLSQAGQVATTFAGSLRSSIKCPNGIEIEAEVAGSDETTAP